MGVMTAPDPLDLFLPPVATWFRRALGAPTPAQRQGWPAIAQGQSTLILAPTGSGKTLAAFLACLDKLWRQSDHPPADEASARGTDGVRVLYISPLKALNNDIYRNLQVPLDGVTAVAREMGCPLPCIDVAVRTGDTPAVERQRLVRQPPHVLITTPESLHLLLTSKAREVLRRVRWCIVDEIHALCPNKRGVFLALLLERLEELNPRSFVRIGLSATQRPLEEVARFLGGFQEDPRTAVRGLEPRPVTVIDAGLRRDLDLLVTSPVEHFGFLPERTIWPSIYRRLAQEIGRHRSTIIFANNRRSVERITANLNDELAGLELQAHGRRSVGQESDEWRGTRNEEAWGADTHHSPFTTQDSPETSVRAHHGSVSLEMRQETEAALKEGRLRAVVATASLELGIDMGAVDLVCQVESPGSIARGLQRVGRAGHIVGQKSKGRLIPKTLDDLVEQAVLAAEMTAGRVEALRVPVNCLDVLAQQIIAMVAMEPWDVTKLFNVIRRAYPYRDLTAHAFESVLEMITGRFAFAVERGAPGAEREAQSAEGGAQGAERDAQSAADPARSALRAPRLTSHALTALHPRISWDRVHNRLVPLPGSQRLALVHGGTIPDTGQYGVYTGQRVRIGEVDEEFVYERRLGDTFILGTNAWRIDEIEADRVLVSPAQGAPGMVPFWRGEQTGRSYDLGLAQGKFLRELAGRLDDDGCLSWLETQFHLDAAAARNLRGYVRRQLDRAGCLPDDRTLVVEAARDQLGDWQVLLLSPFGSRVHLSLRLALENMLKQRLGYRPQCLHHNHGVLIRLSDCDEPVMDLLDGLTPENVRQLILEELADSALFALRFRQNAARALMLPRGGASGRAPLWLQRLRGRDLLQVARRHPDFPIVAETFRECLNDHLDVPHLEELLTSIASGAVQVATRRLEAPSPFGSQLFFAFTAAQMYQYDDVEPAGSPQTAALNQQLLDQIVGPAERLVDSRAVLQVDRRLRGGGRLPRSAAEMAEWLRRLGDLSPSDLEGPMAGFLQELEGDGRVQRILLPSVREPDRWVLSEDADSYRRAFHSAPSSVEEKQQAGESILSRFLETHALVGLQDILRRYPFDANWARRQLQGWAEDGRLAQVAPAAAAEPMQWSAPANLDQVRRGSLALLRREITTAPATQFADFVAHWQGLVPGAPFSGDGQADGPARLLSVLDRLQALTLPADLWEQAVLPARVPGYQPRWLDDVLAGGQWLWHGRAESDGPLELAFVPRESLGQLPPPDSLQSAQLDSAAQRGLDVLRQKGALFLPDLAQEAGLAPGITRAALFQLLRLGLAANDRFETVRKAAVERGAPSAEHDEVAHLPRGGRFRNPMRPPRSSLRAGHSALRAPLSTPAEGRWSLIAWGRPEVEARFVFQATVLLGRYGVAARELALADPLMPPWRVLYEVLGRMELAGRVRRGYFVEGLSGAQFALPEAMRLLQELALPSHAAAPAILLHSQDPANLYGSGAPLDIPLLDGGTRPFLRRTGNWLILRAGRPILLIEQQGRRLTGLASASADDLAAAVSVLPEILKKDRALSSARKLTVEEWNNQPAASTPAASLLTAAGFVRDYQSMTLYAGFR